jgi:hypothetical protein
MEVLELVPVMRLEHIIYDTLTAFRGHVINTEAGDSLSNIKGATDRSEIRIPARLVILDKLHKRDVSLVTALNIAAFLPPARPILPTHHPSEYP